MAYISEMALGEHLRGLVSGCKVRLTQQLVPSKCWINSNFQTRQCCQSEHPVKAGYASEESFYLLTKQRSPLCLLLMLLYVESRTRDMLDKHSATEPHPCPPLLPLLGASLCPPQGPSSFSLPCSLTFHFSKCFYF